MADVEQAFIDEFARLRQGWGLQATQLGDRVGPRLRVLCDIRGTDNDRTIRQKVSATVERLARDLPEPDRFAIAVALGAQPGTQHPRLTDREILLAQRLRCSERTARRRVERAFRRLADEASAWRAATGPDVDDPDTGWRVRRLEALLRLDSPTPRLVERRTIVTERDGLERISARMSLPPPVSGAPADQKLFADAQQGVRIEDRQVQGEAHFRFVLALPRALSAGEEHTYTIMFWVPEGQPIRPHYAYVPLVPCESVQLRVRFDPRVPPRAAWPLHRLPPRVLADRPSPGEAMALDRAGEVRLDVDKPAQGFGYGIGWLAR